MALTIYEVLGNAKINLVDNAKGGIVPAEFGRSQLSNAMELLDADFDLYADFDESWAKHKEATDAKEDGE